MNAIFLLYAREIKSRFTSPMIYILAAIFSGMLGYLFFSLFLEANRLQNISIESAVIRPLFGNINALLIFIIPLLSMKSFSEEKRQATINLLFLSPLSDRQIVTAKILSGVVVMVFFLTLTFIFPLILFMSGYQNTASILSGYIGVFLHGICCLVFSQFCSSLTKNTALAGILGIFGLLFFMSFSWTAQTSQNFLVSQIFDYLSLGSHYEPFSRGTIRSYDLVYYMSFFSFFWFLLMASLDSRNW